MTQDSKCKRLKGTNSAIMQSSWLLYVTRTLLSFGLTDTCLLILGVTEVLRCFRTMHVTSCSDGDTPGLTALPNQIVHSVDYLKQLVTCNLCTCYGFERERHVLHVSHTAGLDETAAALNFTSSQNCATYAKL
jgi:hypothetical protein